MFEDIRRSRNLGNVFLSPSKCERANCHGKAWRTSSALFQLFRFFFPSAHFSTFPSAPRGTTLDFSLRISKYDVKYWVKRTSDFSSPFCVILTIEWD